MWFLALPSLALSQMTSQLAVDVRAFQVVRVVLDRPEDAPVRLGSLTEQRTSETDSLIAALGTLVTYNTRSTREDAVRALQANEADLLVGQWPQGSLKSLKVSESNPYEDAELVLVTAAQSATNKALKPQWWLPKRSVLLAVSLQDKELKARVKELPDEDDEDELLVRVGRGELYGALAFKKSVLAHNAWADDLKVQQVVGKVPLVYGIGAKIGDLQADIDSYCNQHRTAAKGVGSNDAAGQGAPVVRDLAQVQASKVLRVGLAIDGAGYFTHRGAEVGFHFDAMQALATQLEVRLEVVGTESATALPNLLDSGRVDAVIVPQSAASGHLATSPITMNEDILLLLDQVELLVVAVRRNAPKLGRAIDAWVAKRRDSEAMNSLVDKYFPKQAMADEAAPTSAGKALSPYDSFAQKYSSQYGLDWKFITAQMWQESRFNPKAKSWVGALGLMQVMPKTGEEIGILPLDDAEKGLHAGIKYMKKMTARVPKEVSPDERLNFALAAYNAGYGHVIDARKLASDLGLNPNVWFGNAEEGLKLLEKKEYAQKARYGYCRAKETVGYVRKIRDQARKYGFSDPTF